MSVGDLIQVFELGESAAKAETKVGRGGSCSDYECSAGWNPRPDGKSCSRSGCDDETCCFEGDLPGDCPKTYKVLICENCEYGGDFDYRDDPYTVLNDATHTVGLEIVYKDGPGIYHMKHSWCAEGKECNGQPCGDHIPMNKFSMCDSRPDNGHFPFSLNIADEWVVAGSCWNGPGECHFTAEIKACRDGGCTNTKLGDGKYNPDVVPCGLRFPKQLEKDGEKWKVFHKGDKIWPTVPFMENSKPCAGNEKGKRKPKGMHGWVAVDIYAIQENVFEKVLLCEECEIGATYDLADNPPATLNTGLFNAFIIEYVSGPGMQFTFGQKSQHKDCCQDCSDESKWNKAKCGEYTCTNPYNLCEPETFPLTLNLNGELIWEPHNPAPTQAVFACRNSWHKIFDMDPSIDPREIPVRCALGNQGQGRNTNSDMQFHWDQWLVRMEHPNAEKIALYPGDTIYPTHYAAYGEPLTDGAAGHWATKYDQEKFTGYIKVNLFGIRRGCGEDILDAAPAKPEPTEAPEQPEPEPTEAPEQPEPEACEAQKYLDQGYTCAQLEGAGWSMGPCTCPEVQCAGQVYLDMGYTCVQLLEAGHDMTGCGCEDTCQYVCQEYIDQGFSCSECELAGLKCTPCDECGGCGCQKYIDQGYTCSAIEKAGLDCSGCKECEKCECTELLSHGYTCEAIEKHGYDCSKCDCSPKCACTTYLEQGFSCAQVEEAGLDCSHCECSECVAQAYFNQGQTCVTLKQAGIDTTGCGCDDVCACQEYLDQANLGYTCAMLEEAGMDCSSCNCDHVCTDACKHALDQGFTCEQLKGHNMDCSPCDCTPKCSDNCKKYLPSLSCKDLMGYSIDCSGCDECKCSQCGAYLSGYECDALEGTYGMDCSDCTKC